MLPNESSLFKEIALSTIELLSEMEGNKVAIQQSNAVAVLLPLLETGPATVQEHALGIIRNLSTVSENQDVMYQKTGAISAMLRIVLSSSSSKCKESALWTLGNIALTQIPKDPIDKERVYSALQQVLCADDLKIKDIASSILSLWA